MTDNSLPDQCGYVAPKPDSWRCRMGLHVPTGVPRSTIAALARAGVYRPGSWAADACPAPGGYIGPTTFQWCLRCGVGLEPEKEAAMRAKVRAILDGIAEDAASSSVETDEEQGG